MAETAHAAEGLSRKEADRLVSELYGKYRDDLDKRPAGLSFEEVYDLRTLQPNEEWYSLYLDVKAELCDMGLSL